MLVIKVGKKENINQAVKRLKKKVRNIGLIKELRSRQQFEKPSAKKRRKKLKAVYQRKWNLQNGIDV
tara:strand:- start:291 stop:491 length:201 start_codon:yes stop_codon:yes gene_type:complete